MNCLSIFNFTCAMKPWGKQFYRDCIVNGENVYLYGKARLPVEEKGVQITFLRSGFEFYCF